MTSGSSVMTSSCGGQTTLCGSARGAPKRSSKGADVARKSRKIACAAAIHTLAYDLPFIRADISKASNQRRRSVKTKPVIQDPRGVIVAALVCLAATAARAQTESLSPNPLLPSGVGSAADIEEYPYGRSGGNPVGRALSGGDKNPATIMLDELGGTHHGQRTGRELWRGRPVRAAEAIEKARRGSPAAKERAVYFAQRGEYENSLYAPQRGTYRPPVSRRPPVTRLYRR